MAVVVFLLIKKKNPRKGTETINIVYNTESMRIIKKKNPRKGTET